MWRVKERHMSKITHTFLAHRTKNLVTSVTEIENMDKRMLPKVVLNVQKKIIAIQHHL